MVVVPLGLVAAGGPAAPDLLVVGVRLVGVARLQQLGHDVAVELHPLRLQVRPVRTADLGPLVPVEAEPAHLLDHPAVRRLGAAGGVGVLDPQHELRRPRAGRRPS